MCARSSRRGSVDSERFLFTGMQFVARCNVVAILVAALNAIIVLSVRAQENLGVDRSFSAQAMVIVGLTRSR